MIKLGKKITGLALGSMLLAGSMVGTAFADSTTSTTQATTDQTGNQYYQEFISDFASNLGVTEDQVTAALTATKKELAAAAVQQGTMTQAQADQMINQQGFGFLMGGPGGGQGHGDLTQNTTFLTDAASVLGITADQLKADLQAGQTLEDIVTAQGLTMDQFRAKMPQPQQQAGNNAGTTTNNGSATN